jgi:hypothetical protein
VHRGGVPDVTRALHAVVLAALFAAAAIGMLRDGGSSPIVWMDTFNDEREVQRCLAEDACTLVGVATSVPGLMHAAGWLQWRSALARLGLGIDAVHVGVLVLTAIAAVLVFHLASRLGGVPVGVVACWLFLDRIDALLRVTALHNSSVLLFLGAVFLLACTAVVERPGAASVVLAALVGGIVANVHVVGVACGLSVAWVALLAPQRRVRLAALGSASFALATVAIAPGTWWYDLTTLLVRPAGHPVVPAGAENPLLGLALFGVGAWVVASLVPLPAFRGAHRRRAHGAVAVLAPLLGAFAIAPYLGLYPEPKYLLHAKAAAAVAAALPLALLVSPLWRTLPRVGAALDVVLPLALAAALLDPSLVPGMAHDGSSYERSPTLADLRATATILRDQYGWDARRVRDGFKTPYGLTGQVGLAQAFATLAPAPSAVAPPPTPRDAMLVTIAASDLPTPLPPVWHVVRRLPRAAAVLVTLRSVVDWSRSEACALADGEADWTCAEIRAPDAAADVDGGEATGMPRPGRGWRGRIRISATLRPLEPGERVAISMPRIATICGGRIVATPANAELDADGRHATITAPAETGSRVGFEWTVGAPECDVTAYDGAVPFVIEGDAAAVRAVAAIVRGRVT